MSKKSLDDRIDRVRLLARLLPLLLLPLLLLLPGSALAGVHELCLGADRLELDATSRGGGGRGCYRIDVPSSGLLAVEVSAPGSLRAEPRLVFLGDDGSETVRYRIVDQTPRGVLAQVDGSGAVFVLVGPEDPALPPTRCKLHTVFAPRVATKDVEEDDEDGSEIKSLRRPGPDDHGDTPLLATTLELGESVSGMIENDAGDDEDVFTFTVGELRGVRVTATAGHLTLYDAKGQRLASTAGHRAPRLVRTLSPGRYYLRLQSIQGSSNQGSSIQGSSIQGSGEAYVLNLRTFDEP